MHSGYPMMGFTSAVEPGTSLINATAMRTNGVWGAFHEIGHNHQWKQYTTRSTRQTGCNWWALAMNEVNMP